MTTRSAIAEQVQLQYSKAVSSEQSLKKTIDRREIFPLINQATNEILGVQFKESQKLGGVNVPSGMIATYSNNQVLTEHGRSYADLPIYPMPLERDMGVWSVVPQTGSEPALVDGIPYIPIVESDWSLLSATDEGLLEGQVGYYIEGRRVFFTEAISGPVKFKMLISDVELIGDTDPYPVTPDIELMVVERVAKMLIGATRAPKNMVVKEQ